MWKEPKWGHGSMLSVWQEKWGTSTFCYTHLPQCSNWWDDPYWTNWIFLCIGLHTRPWASSMKNIQPNIFEHLDKKKLMKWIQDQKKAMAAVIHLLRCTVIKLSRLPKDVLTTSQMLVHCDSAQPINLATDTSAYGVGTMILHELPDGLMTNCLCPARTLLFISA